MARQDTTASRLACAKRSSISAAASSRNSTRPVRDLARRVRAAGFSEVKEERAWSGSFVFVRGVKKPA